VQRAKLNLELRNVDQYSPKWKFADEEKVRGLIDTRPEPLMGRVSRRCEAAENELIGK
jgi:hypothetical protein